MKRAWAVAIACAILLTTASPAVAHRVDEYLQATTLLVSRGRLQMDMRLAPGVAVASTVLDSIDANRDGVISDAEGRDYGRTVLRDLSLAIDDRPVALRLVSWRSDAVEDMKSGLGEMQIVFEAELPPGDSQRRLVFENHHRAAIAAYLVNGLVPTERDVRITNQVRDYRQSHYEMTYEQGTADLASVSFDTLMRWGLVLLGVTIVFVERLTSWRRNAARKLSPAVKVN